MRGLQPGAWRHGSRSQQLGRKVWKSRDFCKSRGVVRPHHRRVDLSEPGAAELGFWPGEKFWRRIMTEAVTAFTNFWFDNFPSRRIYAESFANNPASARVLEKAGFVFEGRLKNNAVKDGELLDSLLYAKTSRNLTSSCPPECRRITSWCDRTSRLLRRELPRRRLASIRMGTHARPRP